MAVAPGGSIGGGGTIYGGGGGIVTEWVPPPAPAPAPSVSPTTVPVITGIDPSELASATYGKVIPIFVGGLARIGGSIIAGPYFNTVNNALCATFAISFGFASNPTGTRVLFEIALDSKVKWTSSSGTATISSGTFVGSSFTARFYQGTYTQSADPVEIEKWGTNAVAYRPQMVIWFENLPLTDFGNKIPFVAALIGDTTASAVPADGLNLGDVLERLAYSPWVGLSTSNFETSGITDLVQAAILAEDQSFIDMLSNFNRVYRTWSITQTDKLRVSDRGANVTPDIVLDRTGVARGPVIFQRQEPASVAREIELITIDPDADYMMLPSTAKRPREPIAVSGSAGKEVLSLPIVIDAETRQSLVTHVKFAEERSRKRVSLMAMPVAYEIEPGDLVALDGLADGISYEVMKVLETTHGANHTVRMSLEAILNCQADPPSSDYVGTNFQAFSGNDATFTGISIGAAAADRLVVVIAGTTRSFATGPNITGITINGSAATIHQHILNDAGGGNYCLTLAIASLAVPSGATANVVVTKSAVASGECDLHVYALYDLTSNTPHDSAQSGTVGSNPALTLDIPANGVLIAGYIGAQGTPADVVWTGADEDHDQTVLSGNTWRRSAASRSGLQVQSERPVSTASTTGGPESIVAASWG